MKQKQKNTYDPKIETVKCLVLFDQKDQNKGQLNFNTASKVCKFTGIVPSHSIFNVILLKLQITEVHTLNYCYLKFEQNCSHIGGVDTSTQKSVAIVFNHTLL